MKTIGNNAAAGSRNLLLHCYLFLSSKRLVVAQIELVVPFSLF